MDIETFKRRGGARRREIVFLLQDGNISFEDEHRTCAAIGDHSASYIKPLTDA